MTIKKKRAIPTDGVSVLHLAEKRLHQLLHSLVVKSRTTPHDDNSLEKKKERICVSGWSEPTVRWLARALQSGPYHTDHDSLDVIILDDDLTAVQSSDARYLLLCLDMMAVENGEQHIRNLYHTVNHALNPQVRICVAIVGAEDEYKASLHKIYSLYPELRWLVQRHHVTMVNLNINLADQRIDGYTREGLRNWLVLKTSSCKDDADDLMDYGDIVKIVKRELRLYLPEVVTLLRLLLMCAAGCVWVLLTVIGLVAITGEAGMRKDLQTATDSLAQRIVRQRTGKMEWGWRSNGMAITALQLYHRSWCFDSLENQRSMDRMEIGLLGAISRSREMISREITLVQLANHVNALLSTYQNPRDFHGHDLVTSLEDYVIHQVPFTAHHSYSHSMAVIALYNAGVQIERKHVERLLLKQKEDGSFMYGADECAIVAMALACGSQEPEVEVAMRRAVNFLVSQRRSDGSYGSIYATALAVEALNATNTHFSARDQEKTIKWLLSHLDREPSLRSLDVAAQILIAVSGKDLLDIRYFSARLPEKNAVALRNPQPIFLKVDDDTDENTSIEAENGTNSEGAVDNEALIDSHVGTRTRTQNKTKEGEKEIDDDDRKDDGNGDDDEDEGENDDKDNDAENDDAASSDSTRERVEKRNETVITLDQ